MGDSDICPHCGMGRRIDYELFKSDKQERERNFDDYEADYLKRLGHHEEELEEIDYVVLALVRNGVSKYKTLFDRLPKTSPRKIYDSFNKLSKKGYLKDGNDDDSLIEKMTNPTMSLEKKGLDIVEKKILELEENWALLMKHYEAKEKVPLRNEMSNMKGMFPMMFIMGIANGAIMAQMLQMNHMNMNDYFINEPIQIDYLTDPNAEPYTSESSGDFESGGFEVGF